MKVNRYNFLRYLGWYSWSLPSLASFICNGRKGGCTRIPISVPLRSWFRDFAKLPTRSQKVPVEMHSNPPQASLNACAWLTLWQSDEHSLPSLFFCSACRFIDQPAMEGGWTGGARAGCKNSKGKKIYIVPSFWRVNTNMSRFSRRGIAVLPVVSFYCRCSVCRTRCSVRGITSFVFAGCWVVPRSP